MPVPRAARFLVAAFDTAVAAGLAGYTSAFPLAFVRRSELTFHATTSWLAVLAALVATVSIAADLALLGWIAIGYLVWLALFAGHALWLLYLALAVSIAPVLPRPRRSLGRGLAIAAVTAVALLLFHESAPW